jgi:hypothetical protein
VRNFLERLSVGYVNIKTTCVIWDTLLLKTRKDPGDVIVAFALIMLHYKQDLMACSNIIEMCKVFQQKALLLNDYDFFNLWHNFYKEKNVDQQFLEEHIPVTRSDFPTF